MDDVMEAPINEAEAEPAPSLPALIEQLRRPKALLPAPLEKLQEVADMMAASGPMVPAAFQGNAPACLALAYQAARWGMDPVAVASQAYITKDKAGNDRIAYMAQLVAALVHQAPNMVGRLHFEFKGQGSQRFVKVTGKIKGDRRVKPYVSPTIAQIKVKNSPLWFSDPDQQLAYYGERAWARRYMPDVLMGVYAADELPVEEITSVNLSPEDKAIMYGEPDEPDVQDAEFTEEPSGGQEAAQRAQEAPKASAATQGHPNAPPASGGNGGAGAGPSGGGVSSEPASLKQDKAFVGQHVDTILAMSDLTKAQAAWKDLAESAEFKRVVAYDQEVASASKRTVARHVAGLKGDTNG